MCPLSARALLAALVVSTAHALAVATRSTDRRPRASRVICADSSEEIARGFGGVGASSNAPRGFGVWQEEEARAEPPPDAAGRSPEEMRAWRRRVMQGFAKHMQQKGVKAAGEDGELLARFSKVSMRFDDERLVLSPQTWGVRRGQRIGVLGESGCGKSLQLRLLAGKETPTSGAVVIEPGATVELVDQDTPSRLRTTGSTLAEYAREQLRLPADAAGVSSPPQWEALLAILPAELRTPEALGTRLSSFSHGKLVRVATAVALSRAPSLLLLDEPTNHLDLEGIEWLERAVLDRMGEGGVVVVSHDREVLERLSTHLLHSAGGHGQLYAGTYSDFIRTSEVQREALAQVGGAADDEEGESGDGAGGWLPPPLPTRFRPSRFQLLTKKTPTTKGQRARLAEEGAEQPMLSLRDASLEFGVLANKPGSGGVHRAAHEAGGRVVGLSDVCLEVQRGEVLLVVGDNGAGKSTLLRAATGGYPLTAGGVASSSDARPFFLTQDAAHGLRGESSAWEWIRSEAPDATDEACRRTMRKMGIPPEAQSKPLDVMSGGERTRLCIASMLLSRANLLVLDEPTNHLDLLAREYLQEALRAFDGGVLLVSHDRHFAAGVATRVVEIRGGHVLEADGDYRAYIAVRDDLHERIRRREIEGDERSVTAQPAAPTKRQARRQRSRSNL